MVFVRTILKKIFESNLMYYFVCIVGLLFLFKKDVFRSKYFTDSKIGYVWLLNAIWYQRILGFNRFSRYIVHHTTKVGPSKNFIVHKDSIDALTSPGCYFQCFDAQIILDKDVLIGPNVGLITSNHDPCNPEIHLAGSDIVIKEGSWVGMNSVILPGVELGPGTIVAAGSVVTKSFPDGKVMISGTPAKVKKYL